MITTPSLEALNLGVTLPAVSLALGACLLLLIDVFLPRNRRHWTPWLALAGIVVSFVLNVFTFRSGTQALDGMFVADEFTGFLNATVLIATSLTILLSIDYLKRTGMERGEFYILLLFSSAGAMFMASANDIIVVFVGLELLSIPLYIMAALRYNDLKSEESGIKYFILGAFSSAFFVYGAALIYGATGTTNLPGIFDAVGTIVAAPERGSIFYLLIGTALFMVGLGFKVAVVPFHQWTPDVYEGAPTPVTAFMSVAAKIGGFAALLRIMVVGLPALTAQPEDVVAIWQNTAWIVAALTMIVGNFIAVAQTNIKRLLAYSSIAHAGYILMAIAAAGTAGIAPQATQAALVYLLAYTFTNLGAFAVAISIEKDDGTGTEIADFTGLGRSQPLMAGMMTIFVFSLIGIPLTGGFIGKWLVFQSSISAGLIPLAIIGVLTSVVSAYYYVRIIVNMWQQGGEGDAARGATPYVSWVVYISFTGTLLLGIAPFLVTNLTNTVNIASSLLLR